MGTELCLRALRDSSNCCSGDPGRFGLYLVAILMTEGDRGWLVWAFRRRRLLKQLEQLGRAELWFVLLESFSNLLVIKRLFGLTEYFFALCFVVREYLLGHLEVWMPRHYSSSAVFRQHSF